MRLWSLHPGFLDTKGLVALWREGLLAQKVLLGKTKGYKNHPQLMRFKKTTNPGRAIASFLRGIVNEADCRGYNFDRSKIIHKDYKGTIPVTSGQLEYEFQHLLRKLKERDPERFARLETVKRIKFHPIFKKVSGNVEKWEKV
ncbi:MAG: pyrimidine dimer DNA glycosylase/endonuclease V [Candidatus Scalindua sp.]|nr:pyrimidine dimer DNA glycosylase/endonuclease V [Candidatus Scalindua sp.]